MNTNLWYYTQNPQDTTENWLRAFRVLDYLNEGTPPICYKDIKSDLGLSYYQVLRVVGLLCALGEARVTVIPEWNGCYYIYPHHVWPTNPRSL